MLTRRAFRWLTPKEFSEAIGGLLCAKTIRGMCARGELRTMHGPDRVPYFIHPDELTRFRPECSRLLVAV